MRLTVFLLSLLGASLGMTSPAAAVTVVLRVTVPDSTPADATIHVAGDFQGWNPGDPAHALASVAANVHEIALTLPAGTRIEFKFTRGSWATVEKGSEGQEIGNRVLTVNEDRTYELSVARWADTQTQRTLTGDVSEHTVPGLLDGRRVWVYLPPGYHESDAQYPVLYMLDGQNVFDASTSFAGEWQVDESCERLIAEGRMRPIVVVAIDNGGARRVDEYTPSVDERRGMGGEADAHFAAIRDVLMPWVETNYRVLTGPAETGFSGSSLGGLMSLLAALDHDDRFGRIGAISPSLWWDDRMVLDLVDVRDKPDVRLWADMGTLEGSTVQGNEAYVQDLRDLRAKLLAKGFVEGEDLVVFEDEGARHNESSWSARFPRVLEFLFPPASAGVGGAAESFGDLKRSY